MPGRNTAALCNSRKGASDIWRRITDSWTNRNATLDTALLDTALVGNALLDTALLGNTLFADRRRRINDVKSAGYWRHA